ncbi:MAG: SpoIIE family protein phosphatase, partial [Solirubrobacterales bacterium]|nr:SpoIIE family protein phosphatase [Solirubrobacterales bacterium]
ALTSVTSGEDALKQLLNEDFAMVLLDVQMPGMDGFETAELIKGRERTRNVPIIFVTAISKERHHVYRGYSSGAVDYVFKPYDPAVLRSKVAVFLELHAASRAATRSEAVMRAAFDHAPIGMARVDLEGRIAEVNQALAGLLGRQPADLRDRLLDDVVHPDDVLADRDRRRALCDGGIGSYEHELRLVSRDGEHVPCDVSFSIARAGDGAPDVIVAQFQDLRERLRARAERERLLREQAAREQAEQVSQRLEAVQRITDVALGSLAFDELVQELLRRTADVLSADTAAIVLHEEGEEATVYQVAGAVDAGLQTSRWPVAPGGMSERVVEHGRPAAAEDVAAEGPEAAHPLGDAVTSVLGVPLVVEGRPIGALHIGTLFTRRFSPEDAALLGLAADRAALAIERVRLFEREHRIAQELQRSLLPGALPALPGIAAAARYQPAGAGSQVGGDWYDALVQPDGRLLLVIGDVAGRGIEAASTMGQLRSALRAYAFDGHGPAALLDRLNAFQLGLQRSGMATVALVSVDPVEECVCYATAGHPPALIVSPEGEVSWLRDSGGLPLGVTDDFEYTEVAAPMAPGSTLVLYTDGLVETRGEHLDEGFARLEAAALAGAADLDSLCDGVLIGTLADPDVDDDVTVLVVRTVSASDPRVELTVPGNATALQAFRSTTRRWLAGASDDEAEVDDITMAVNEAVQNAIEHGHRRRSTPVTVVLERSGADLEVVVLDQGRWTDGSSDDRGRGLALMRALMDDVTIDAESDGTRLVLRRRLRRPSATTA